MRARAFGKRRQLLDKDCRCNSYYLDPGIAEIEILIVNLDAAGKTTILYKIA